MNFPRPVLIIEDDDDAVAVPVASPMQQQVPPNPSLVVARGPARGTPVLHLIQDDADDDDENGHWERQEPLSEDDRLILAFLKRAGVAHLYDANLEERKPGGHKPAATRNDNLSGPAKDLDDNNKLESEAEEAVKNKDEDAKHILRPKKEDSNTAASNGGNKQGGSPLRQASSPSSGKDLNDENQDSARGDLKRKVCAVQGQDDMERKKAKTSDPDLLRKLRAKKEKLKQNLARTKEWSKRNYMEKCHRLERETGSKVLSSFEDYEEWCEKKNSESPRGQVRASCEAAVKALGRKFQVRSVYWEKRRLLRNIEASAIAAIAKARWDSMDAFITQFRAGRLEREALVSS